MAKVDANEFKKLEQELAVLKIELACKDEFIATLLDRLMGVAATVQTMFDRTHVEVSKLHTRVTNLEDKLDEDEDDVCPPLASNSDVDEKNEEQ